MARPFLFLTVCSAVAAFIPVGRPPHIHPHNNFRLRGSEDNLSQPIQACRLSEAISKSLRFVAPRCGLATPQEPVYELQAEHYGAPRIVWHMDTNDWLEGTVELSLLPAQFNVVTSLPDISELHTRRRRISAEEYENWFVQVVNGILYRLPPDQVCIFYQTPGRNSGVDGQWLDKGFLCQIGARLAGARCVWQKVVLDGPPGLERAGRPGFIHMLCFSKLHRSPGNGDGFRTVDVVERGKMSYAKAMGENACKIAVEYCARWVDAPAGQDPRGIPSAILDPFCGHGSVLAAANRMGAAAYGIDLSAAACQVAINYTVAL